MAKMIFQTSSWSSPWRCSHSGGRRRPSWKMSVASPASPPGALAPGSARWAQLATKATISPSWNTALSSVCSGMWPLPR